MYHLLLPACLLLLCNSSQPLLMDRRKLETPQSRSFLHPPTKSPLLLIVDKWDKVRFLIGFCRWNGQDSAWASWSRHHLHCLPQVGLPKRCAVIWILLCFFYFFGWLPFWVFDCGVLMVGRGVWEAPVHGHCRPAGTAPGAPWLHPFFCFWPPTLRG